MENCSKCLICNCTTTTEEFISRDISSSLKTAKHEIHRHLYVIFILRNILELPVHQLANHLKNNWQVQNWISLCGRCNELIVKCREIHDQLLQISKRFKSCQLSIINIVKESGCGAGEKFDRKKKRNFVEQARDFVSEYDYQHLIDPMEKMRSWACRTEVKNELVDPTAEEDVITNALIKTEVESQSEDYDDVPSPAVADKVPEDRLFSGDEDYGLSEREDDELKPGSNDCNITSVGKHFKEPVNPNMEGKYQFKNLKTDNEADIRECPYSRENMRKKYPCNSCGTDFHTKEEFNRHQRRHHPDEKKKHQCDECPYSSNNNCHLKRHKKNRHQPKPSECFSKRRMYSECNICQQFYKEPKTLARHKKRMHGTEVIKDGKGGSAATPPTESGDDNGTLHNPMDGDLNASDKRDVDAGNKPKLKRGKKCGKVARGPCICETCGNVFANNKTLQAHRLLSSSCKRLHMSEEEATVMCEICGNRYCTKYSLKVHILRTHERIYNYRVTCSDCGRKFDSAPKLSRHLAARKDGESCKNRLCKCLVEGCDMTFTSSQRRTSHHQEQHKGIAMQFKCGQCGKEFSCRKYLRQHVRQVHTGVTYDGKNKKRPLEAATAATKTQNESS